ncbi:unnamed protein product [Closterium sp. NIES-53]
MPHVSVLIQHWLHVRRACPQHHYGAAAGSGGGGGFPLAPICKSVLPFPLPLPPVQGAVELRRCIQAPLHPLCSVARGGGGEGGGERGGDGEGEGKGSGNGEWVKGKRTWNGAVAFQSARQNDDPVGREPLPCLARIRAAPRAIPRAIPCLRAPASRPHTGNGATSPEATRTLRANRADRICRDTWADQAKRGNVSRGSPNGARDARRASGS